MSSATARRLLPVLGFALLAACARAVAVGSDPGPVYSIIVRNTLSTDMIVSYDAGSGPAILGTVRASGTERFVITSRNTTSVTITARDAASSRSSGPYTVQLATGTASEVVLR